MLFLDTFFKEKKRLLKKQTPHNFANKQGNLMLQHIQMYISPKNRR